MTELEYMQNMPQFQLRLARVMPAVQLAEHYYWPDDGNAWLSLHVPMPESVIQRAGKRTAMFIRSFDDFTSESQWEGFEQSLRAIYEDCELDPAILYKKD